MSRDYKSRATRHKKKSLPGYVWLLSGLAIGLFVAFIVYLDKQPESKKDFGTAVQEELKKIKQQAKEKSTTKKEQKFNFYTILPELEILIPESETRPPERTAETKNKTVTTNTSKANKSKQYVLQVGSFQSLNDAKKLKANLAFLGLSANIQHVTVNKQAWHRVRTGPYKDKQQLYKNQKTLKQNGIHAISMELKQ
ncbi:MAG: SPOR domain-containing protein [Gammaproteobacteria bacterium]|nr:SPOR domain-containing protein [Gammaproteobacteria bacterium]